MAERNRFAFTLVELLVVIVIVGMLAALLLQAVIGAREAARRTRCFNNQEEIAKAMALYELAKKNIPGYVNRNLAPGVRPPLSWAVVLLPYLGRDDLWTGPRVNPADPQDQRTSGWRTCCQGSPPAQGVGVDAAYGTACPNLAQFLCPSGKPAQDRLPLLDYVVNCGLPDVLPPDCNALATDKPFGLFHNLYLCPQLTVTTADIPDGASETLMLSENLNATVAVGAPSGTPAVLPVATEADVGMVWWSRQSIGASAPGRIKINGRVDPSFPDAIWYARPSSNHPGGVVATFCDGHVEFVSQDMDYRVFQQRMCPNDNSALGLFVRPGS